MHLVGVELIALSWLTGHWSAPGLVVLGSGTYSWLLFLSAMESSDIQQEHLRYRLA